jgi:hypothetical protein
MTTETPNEPGNRHDLMRSTVLFSVLLLAGATAVTWAWNTILPDYAGLAPFRFAEGISIAIGTLLLGALFETGRGLAARFAFGRRAPHR